MTEFTIQDSFQDLEKELRHFTGCPYPEKPKKPAALPNYPSAQQARDYANQVDQYEIELAESIIQRDVFNQYRADIERIWHDKLSDYVRFHSDTISPPAWDKIFTHIYSLAYDDAHSGGYEEVRIKVESYSNLVYACMEVLR